MTKEREVEIRALLRGLPGRSDIAEFDEYVGDAEVPLMLAIWDLLVELGAVREQLTAANYRLLRTASSRDKALDELLQLRSKMLADTIEITEEPPADEEPGMGDRG
jgi:hypothetical protein